MGQMSLNGIWSAMSICGSDYYMECEWSLHLARVPKPNPAFRHGDVDSHFGRFGVDTSSIALSSFGPDSGFMVAAFLVFDFTTV